jgi:hypothetical protein
MMDRINTKLAAVVQTGPTVLQSSEARLHRQPTPSSIAAAESRVGTLSAQSVEAVDAAMAHARAADHDGDGSACEQALAEVQRLIDSWPQ